MFQAFRERPSKTVHPASSPPVEGMLLRRTTKHSFWQCSEWLGSQQCISLVLEIVYIRCLHIWMYVYIYIHACMHACRHAYRHACICICVCISICTRTHTHTHRDRDTCKSIPSCSGTFRLCCHMRFDSG